MRKEKGITLVSLVVTIIILIILAGISINLTLGENGIITIAKQAKENTELAKIEEETALNELYSQISETNYGSISYDEISKLVEFKKEIASAITDMGITTSENATADTMASNIRSIVGTTTADKVSYDNTNSGLTATNVQGAIDEVNNSLTNMSDFLDFSNRINITSYTSSDMFTAPENGTIYVNSGSNNNGLANCVASIVDENNNVMNLSAVSYNGYGNICMLKVLKGWKIYTYRNTANTGVVYFYYHR